jgi:pyruvate kinase
MSVHTRDGRRKPALTKILATIGPASEDEETLTKLVEAGATLFRLNFSHGEFEEHKRRLETIRRIGYKLNTPLTVLGDLPGPKLRVGTVPDPGIELHPGQRVEIRTDVEVSQDGERPVLRSDYPAIVEEVHVGHRVLINDGMVRMLVVDTYPDRLLCNVTVGGLVTTRKGLNLPDSDLSVPAVTERDWELVAWAVDNHIDYLALSFVRSPAEVRQLRDGIKRMCQDGICGTGLTTDDEPPTIPIVAKIETPQGVRNFEGIVNESDAIMVARGDLGVEMEIAEVPMIQKRLIKIAHEQGKPCIVATQMLESMIDRPNATRAEVSDVANAIVDGADCVMLSGETAVGQHPVLAVEMMRRVSIATELELRNMGAPEPNVPRRLREQHLVIPALAHGAWHMARDVDARAVIIWSQSGGGARYLSRYNFQIPIVAFSSNETAVRRMNLLYAVFPVLWLDVPEHRSEFARLADTHAVEEGWVERGEPIILLGGKPLDRPGSTNTVAVRFAGELLEGELGDSII